MGNLALRRRASNRKGYQDAQDMGSNESEEEEQLLYSREEVLIMREFLPDFNFSRPSTQIEGDLVINHWDELMNAQRQLADNLPGTIPFIHLFDTFYVFLFEINPTLQPIFHNSMQIKGRALLNIVGGIRSLLRSEDVLQRVTGIAQRHIVYGVTYKHFNPFGVALMKTLETLAPDLWTDQVEFAWKVVYAHVAVLILKSLHHELRQPVWRFLRSNSKSKSIMDATIEAIEPGTQGSVVSFRENSKRRLSDIPALTTEGSDLPTGTMRTRLSAPEMLLSEQSPQVKESVDGPRTGGDSEEEQVKKQQNAPVTCPHEADKSTLFVKRNTNVVVPCLNHAEDQASS